MSILIKNSARGTCPTGQWLRLPSMQGVQVQPLVRKLRSHVPWGVAKKWKKKDRA